MYNGWKNYGTWRIGCCVIDDSHWDNRAYELAYDEESADDAIDQLEDEIRDRFESEVYEFPLDWKRDLLELSLAEVDWNEIAETCRESADKGEEAALEDEEDL